MNHLRKSTSDTTLALDSDALLSNLKAYRNILPAKHRIMAMLKANAYGLGVVPVAKILEENHIDYFGVAYADEGAELREAGILSPIMVMNPGEKSIQMMLSLNLEPEIYSWGSLNRYLEAFEVYPKSLSKGRIHIKVDTGMNRLGFKVSDAYELTSRLSELTGIIVVSVMSHLSSAESAVEDSFTKEQGVLFNSFCDIIEKGIQYRVIRHIANTSATERFPNLYGGMVRLGIGLFGHSPVLNSKLKLSPVVFLNSSVTHIHDIGPGESVSYGRTFNTDSVKKIATISIGYADGFPRILSNGIGQVVFKNQFFPVAGRVCMDMTMIDVTGSQIKVGDQVEIFGKNISVEMFAKACETSTYEVLTRISPRLKRIKINL